MKTSKVSSGIQEDIETRALRRKKNRRIFAILVSILLVLCLVLGGFLYVKSGMISRSEAQRIALKDSKYTANEVINLKTKLELTGVKFVYEVSFRVKSDIYHYYILASSGKIADKEINDNKDAHLDDTQDPFDMKTDNTTSIGQPKATCTKPEAKKIVLKAAGVSIGEIDAYVCRTNKYNHYVIRFVAKGKEYNYELDFEGKILDEKIATISEMKLITKEEALQIALSDAGVDNKGIRNTETKYEEKSAVFKIKFSANGTDFKYTIDSTGSIIDYKRGVALN